ncbi:MAG: hypothetical protein QOE91_1094 [Gaiellaceae bacterium]|nr:hypothetical protein [Gaiellaceae bacterium]
MEASFAYARSEGWATSVRDLPDLGPLERRVTGEGREIAVLEVDGALVQLGLYSGSVFAMVAADEEGTVTAALERLHAALPAPDPSSAHEVTVTFWTYGPHGPMPSWRSIAVPSWEDIAPNYTGATRRGLASIMSNFQPAHGGQLVLWHGNAGTGKTFALRALAWQWRDWCDFHYIVDPDSLFGQHADYLMSVLLQPSYMGVTVASSHGFIHQSPMFAGTLELEASGSADDQSEDENAGKPWRVLVLEDTGELLSADARVSMGQGLSRFLNVVDGLIGQGLRVLVLVTTNEPIRRLHPAVARPGRCAANIEFLPLDPDEASEWLEAHDSDPTVAGASTIAELFARLEGIEPSAQPIIGFGDVRE